MIRFGERVCRNLEWATTREWLETNGLGGFASSTITGMNTRRYHGLLVTAMRPPVGRMVLLSKMEETLVIDGRRYELAVNRYPGVIHPTGHVYLKEFRLDPFPTFIYEIAGVEIEKSIFMAFERNTTVIRYELRGAAAECRLELRPLIAFRDYHCTTHENGALDPRVDDEGGNLKITPYAGLPSLYLSHAGEARATGVWYRDFEYDRERERGLDYREDLFNPCVLLADFGRNRIQPVIASTEPSNFGSVDALRASETERRRALTNSVPAGAAFAESLTRAADQFLVRRGEERTIIAGYPWFTDWGRDTMIALPGLTLSTGRPDAARSILRAFAGCGDRGMLPNRFPDAGEAPEYNTADAALWFFEAARAYLAHTGDLEFIRTELYDVLTSIISWHERGTRYGIRVDDDGLLLAGEAGVQLTWMDAKVGDWVVTPRQGKAVEIQALWYNALRTMEDVSELLGRGESAHYRKLAARAKAAFSKLFWNAEADCLYDTVDGDTRGASIRPNQVFAVSLFHTMVSRERAARIVDAVERHLLTPFGLRTLAPSDPQYRGRYEGGPQTRDGAYHQGTVWPWLMGPFASAYLRVHGRSAESRARVAGWLSTLQSFMEDEGVGQLPEVFDGDSPHRAGGCVAQAWSVAELLRACEEVSAPEPRKARSRASA